MPFRPDPIAEFGLDDYYAELRRRKQEAKLRETLTRIGRDLKHLTRRKRKVRKALAKVQH
jgi:hypothetical protein